MSTRPEQPDASMIADAARDASEETAVEIDRAIEKNDDPEVGEILEKAALKADQTTGRVGWLRSFIHRLFRGAP